MKKSIKLFLIGGTIFILGLLGVYKIVETHSVETQNLASLQEEHNGILVQNNKQKSQNIEFDLVAGGDVMMSRHVGTKILESGDNAMPFRNIAEIFSQADISFVNLEAPFYDQGDYVTEGMVFKVEPEYIEGLKLAGIDIVSLANNHTRNRGRAGLVYTLDYLKENGIEYTGAGKNFEEAHQDRVIDIQGLKIAILAYTYSDGNDFTSSVGLDDPDVAFMETEQMEKDVMVAKEENDVVIVSMHAGIEYKHYPNQQQQEFAKAAIDAGAELVLGHHPHVVQSTEKYNNGYIIYSLGNLVFDQMWSEETREGIIARCSFQGSDLNQIEFIPIKIYNYSQPRLATTAESAKILSDMGLEDSIVEI